MPFFRESYDDHDVRPPPATEAEIASRPLPIYGLRHSRRQAPTSEQLGRGLSEESIRTDFCEGPLADDHEIIRTRHPEPERCARAATSDRAELIERLKRGESPTWVPTRKHDSFFPRDGSRDHSPSPRPRSRGSPGLLAAPATKDRTDTEQAQETDWADRMQEGLDIERPRSALHSGDFTQHTSGPRYDEAGKRHGEEPGEAEAEGDACIPDRRSAWFATSPPRDFTPFRFEGRTAFPDLVPPSAGYRSSPPSLSSSLSSSFVFKHPTSPLVQSESNDDLSIHAMELDPGTPSRMPRRQTLHTFHSPQSIPITAQRIPTTRRESTFPYQAHQPRKSLTSVPTAGRFMASASLSPQKIVSPYPACRRPSVALDSSSPLQRTSMVGSYEESILRGRMSTSPSKPLDFLAQIGVLGLGNCKSSLRCPAHVTLPFPAVFYSYASTPHGRSKSDDGPSPYVGSIDLENGLPSNLEGSRARRRSGQRERAAGGRRSRAGSVGPDAEMGGMDDSTSQRIPDSREVAKHRRRAGSSSLRAPPGGSYRIPEKGQIQIIIKNQNKTAVKLFLVPYDLAGMEAGTKTFIRQRAYVGGPLAADRTEPTATTTTSTTAAEEKAEKPVLRYLVHLHICCPAKGRFYLYKSVRVVFANRVPDGKERLRNEITLPEPRFTPYKATRIVQQHQHQHLYPGPAPPPPPPPTSLHQQPSGPASSFGQVDVGRMLPDLPTAFELRRRAASVQDHGAVAAAAAVFSSTPAPPVAGFVPLNFPKRGEVGLANGAASGPGGIGSVASAGVAAAESLLSMRLRSLGMQGACRGEMDTEEGAVDGRGR